MKKNLPLIIAGIIFSIVALAHLLRIIYLPVISVDGYLLPLMANYIGFAIALLLAIWMFTASSTKSAKNYYSETKSLAKEKKIAIRKRLAGFNVAMLVSDGFEQSEMTGPKKALEAAGAKVHIISPIKGNVKGWVHGQWGKQFPVDVHLDHASPHDYDGLVLPGGVINPDRLRLIPSAIQFIKHFQENNKPIAAICHGPWTLINADVVRGRKVTSWPSIKTDLVNAGAQWFDERTVREGKLLTSRKPDDIPAFNVEMIEMFAESKTSV